MVEACRPMSLLLISISLHPLLSSPVISPAHCLTQGAIVIDKEGQGIMINFSALIPAGLQSPTVKRYLALKNNTSAEPGLTRIEGLNMLWHALTAGVEISSLFVCPTLLRGEVRKDVVQTLIAAGVPAYQISEKVLVHLTEWEGPDGLVAIVRLPHTTLQTLPLQPNAALLVLDNLQIPGNIGTIIRSADGAGIDGVILADCKPRLTHPKTVRASMGSLFSFPVVETTSTEAIAWLKRQDFTIITADPAAALSYRQADYRGRVAVVMGNERNGISSAWSAAQDSSVFIPMAGRADSLNVGSAAVVLLYEMIHQQGRVQ